MVLRIVCACVWGGGVGEGVEVCVDVCVWGLDRSEKVFVCVLYRVAWRR